MEVGKTAPAMPEGIDCQEETLSGGGVKSRYNLNEPMGQFHYTGSPFSVVALLLMCDEHGVLVFAKWLR